MVGSKRIWILEDETVSQKVYEHVLKVRYEIEIFDEISALIEKFSEEKAPDLIIADILLKDGNFINFIKNNPDYFGRTPIMYVSSVDDYEALKLCFEMGAKDFLAKPINKNVFLVKIESYFKNSFNQTIFDLEHRSVQVDGQNVENLTGKQIQLLSLFVKSPSRSVTRDQIMNRVWGKTVVHPKTIDVHLYNLRRKLQTYGLIIKSDGSGRWSLMSQRLNRPMVAMDQ